MNVSIKEENLSDKSYPKMSQNEERFPYDYVNFRNSYSLNEVLESEKNLLKIRRPINQHF